MIGADGDGGIRHIEGRKIPALPMHLDEVDDIADAQTGR